MSSPAPQETPSLFQVSLPRSLSSTTWQWARELLGLAAPGWVTDGEVLNLERFSFASTAAAVHFLRPSDGPAFDAAREHLQHLVRPTGWAYKDVTQPFVVAAALSQPGPLRVLKIHRSLADVALAMGDKGWTYPARGVRRDDADEALIEGLLDAQEALDSIPGLAVDFDDLVMDELALPASLRSLYPGLSMPDAVTFDEAFLRARDEVLTRRRSERHRILGDRVLQAVQRRAERRAKPTDAPRATSPGSGRRSRPRILVVGDAVAPTGFSRVTESIFRPLSRDYDIHQLGIKYAGGAHDLPWTLHPAIDARGVSKLPELCASLAPDLVFLVNDIWVLGDHARALGRVPGRHRLVAYCPVDSGPLSAGFLAGLQGVHRLVAYTAFGQGELSAAASRLSTPPTWPRVDIIPHGIDTSVFHPLAPMGGSLVASRRASRAALFGTNELDDAFIVLNANRNQPRKLIDLTVRGFAAFAQGRPDARLYLHMGTEDVGWDVRGLAERFGITDRVIISTDQRFAPRLSLAQLNHVYNACDVGVNTSSSEGWGLVAFEHAATGAAQVVPGHTAPGELWAGSAELLDVALTLCQPRILTDAHVPSVESLTAALTRLYEDRAHLEARSRAAHALATRPTFRWDTIALAWARLFEDELTRGGGRS
ncbi:glycosyltransferase family 1 protein [Corallococcus exiguus]|uniref:glycosyltransferase family 1 protein n=1 Tax=Corallococcus TaxID=83461 RepID=UPI000EBFA63F|nr:MULTISPECIES: glycosyltransferase family 1 protein [Corallococcus]NNB88210.1 glycosyltransferase family 1 protein [Corallococcus exiguus]NNB94607.1 glycosyltransferase family 1 protein [Corallococcus exiguus]NNC08567.1 glycosyltransferase family 1 protein [Corallococcus exiguus]NPC48922.1 glycosyltransferase family 1 protein [Corallococcus exiguus]RKH84956.1 glycosyltransferase family 1 protein [Corallococcus sp. AB032C]